MKLKSIRYLALTIAIVCFCSFNAWSQPITVQSTYKHITIDGSFSDWAGVPLATNQAQIVGDKVQFKDLYVANDENYLYIRFSLYTPTNPFTSSQNIFFDRDTNAATGYSENGIGSDLLIQSGAGYQEQSGVFNAGTVNGLNWLAAPAVPADDFEVRISRNSTYASDGSLIFTNNTIAIFLETGEAANRFFPNTLGGLLYTFAAAPSSLSTNLLLLSYSNSSWKVNDSGTDLGTDWLDQNYDDSSWTSGLGLFGFTPSTAAYPAIQTPLATGANTYYFRTHFNWTNSTTGIAFIVTNYLSDGAVYYMNGAEVRRIRMPADNIAYNTSATGTNSPEGNLDVFPVSADPLVVGDNIFEVETHQAPGSASDMVFGMSLVAATQYPVTILNASLPADTNVIAGEPVTFSSDVFGSGLNYQWLKDGNPIADATNATLTIPLVLTNDAGSYSLQVANTISTNTTRSALLTVTSTPIVFTDPNQPADQYIVEGRPVTLSVAASGSAIVSYQWYQNSNLIPDATNASYAISAVSSTNSGSYYALVSNPAGSTNSRTASLTVLLDSIPPSVTNITATSRQIVITFSEPVDAISANNLANYTLSGGATITNATLNGQIVTLTTGSPLSIGTIYSLTVNGVDDLFGNAANVTVSLAPTIIITIDGNMSDWQGVTPVYSGPSGNDGGADFKDIYVYNDADYYYFRVTLWHDIPSANGFFPKYANLHYNTDNDINTGYVPGTIGSELLQQSSSFYQEKNGSFNDGVAPVNMGYLIAPTTREASFPADFEWRYSRAATFGGGGLIFSTNVISFIFQGNDQNFVAQNFAPSDGSGPIAYTNSVPTVVPGLPPGNLSISSLPDGKVVLVWDTAGMLQVGDLGGNSWTNLPSATSPYAIPTGGQQFFRLVK